MPNLRHIFGFDAAGDACMFVQVVTDEGEPVRFLNDAELRAYMREDREEDAELPEGIGVCLTCGGECDEDGICEKCDEEGEDNATA